MNFLSVLKIGLAKVTAWLIILIIFLLSVYGFIFVLNLLLGVL